MQVHAGPALRFLAKRGWGSDTGTSDAGARGRHRCDQHTIRRPFAGFPKNGRSRHSGPCCRQARAFCDGWPIAFDRQEHRCGLERHPRIAACGCRCDAFLRRVKRRGDDYRGKQPRRRKEECRGCRELPRQAWCAGAFGSHRSKFSQTADALVEAARTFDADLPVSGGYGHSRFREWVFGALPAHD